MIEIVRAERCHLADIVRMEQAHFPDPWSERLLERKLHDPDVCFLVAEADGNICGYAILQLLSPEAELLNLAVEQDVQRQGIARQLVTQLFNEAMAKGIDTIHLEVRASNIPALTLYNILGFETVGRRKAYYQNPTEDAVLMTMRKV